MLQLSTANLLTVLSVALLGGPATYLAWLAFSQARMVARRRTRLAGGAGIPAASQEPILSSLFNSIRRLGQRLAIQDPSKLSVIRLRLIQAGYFNRDAVTYYLAGKFTALVVAAIAAVLLLPWAITSGGGGGGGVTLLALALALVTLLGPDHVVRMRRATCDMEYRDGFPDLLDLLVASVEAGLSLDSAVTRVGDELARRYPRLTEHLRFLTLELRAGRDRRDAWQSFAERLGLDEARSFATMLRQAEEMGTSLGDTLRVFSEDMRIKRMLRAEENAMALPAKLIVPLILFIFPCLLGVIMLPAIYSVMLIMKG